MTAVEWLYKNLLENPISNQDIEYNEAVFHNAKEMEKEQLKEMYLKGIENYDPTFKRKNNLSQQDKP